MGGDDDPTRALATCDSCGQPLAVMVDDEGIRSIATDGPCPRCGGTDFTITEWFETT